MPSDPRKPTLEPFQVPWMASPSTPFLELKCVENSDAEVLLNAFFGYHVEQGRDQRIRLSFRQCLCARMLAPEPGFELLNEKSFDWSKVWIDRSRTAEGCHRNRNDFDAKWERTGICPSPGAYEVVGGSWSGRYGGHMRHFLVEGHDAYVEVLAREWTWESVRVLDY